MIKTNGFQVGEINKFITLVIVNIGAIFLCWTGSVDSNAVIAILSASLGYVFGNGHGLIAASAVMQTLSAQAAQGGDTSNGNSQQ